MSMISSQIDELRATAEEIDWEFPFVASRLREAADTIWQLRDDLQRANEAVRDAEHDESCAWGRVRKAEADNDRLREQGTRLFDKTLELGTENDKLRKLIADLWEYIYIGTAQDGQSLHDRTRELGVEVDDA